jgi:hypothetical protein
MNSTQKVYYKYGYDDALRGDDYDPPEDAQLKKAYAEGWHSGSIKRSRGENESSAFRGSEQGLMKTGQDVKNREFRSPWGGKGKRTTRKHSKKARKTRRGKLLRRKL